MAKACRFVEYTILLSEDGSVKLEELEADKLGICPGDTFLCFVDPDTKEVTMKKFDISSNF